jgi:hypothetical protein
MSVSESLFTSDVYWPYTADFAASPCDIKTDKKAGRYFWMMIVLSAGCVNFLTSSGHCCERCFGTTMSVAFGKTAITLGLIASRREADEDLPEDDERIPIKATLPCIRRSSRAA